MAGQVTDMSATILEFLADSTRSSMELPHMTTGQRKAIKKLVEEYPELRCESFGFGQDRQLHLFKKQFDAGNAGGAAVSVKNTFINDFVENKLDEESRNVSTMPPALSRMLVDISAEMDFGKRDGGYDLPSTVASSTNNSNMNSPTRSQSPLGQQELLPPRAEAPLSAPPGIIAPPPGLEVRNTFLHYGKPPADERIVQSMPHGMFGQCLLAEAAKAASGAVLAPVSAKRGQQTTTPFPSVLDAAAENGSLAPGTDVVTTGLSKLPGFNGLHGTIQTFDKETGRFSVLLAENVGGHKWAKVKRENLALAAAPLPAPLYSPRLPSDEQRNAQPLTLNALV
jgi:hypothetical protein